MKPELKLKIRMKETVVFVAPNGTIVATRAGREVLAAEILTDDGKAWYLVFGETGFPRFIPRWAAEVIEGTPALNGYVPGQGTMATN